MQKNIVITIGIVFGLAACSSTGTLQSPKGDTNITGTVIRGAFEPHIVEVRLEGKTYRGEWRTGAPTPEQKAATSYPHRKHIGQVKSTLRADDGSTLDCAWQSHGDTAEGNCSKSGRDYLLNLK
ncbi:MAG: hypothetical protein OEV35_00065 [Gallionellaceae bacterium]|nr:hypothetical protein [Gallionellaceae bacterium]